MQEREKIKQLFERYKLGQCTPEEEATLHAWFNHYTRLEAHGLDDLVKMDAIRPIDRKRQRVRRLSYAAAVVLILTISWYTLQDKASSSNPVATAVTHDIAPGGNRATLILSDGRKVDLSEMQSGIVVGETGILYENETENIVALEQDVQLLTLSVPKGGTYQVTLSDGTKVWLNATSTLTYPSRFSEIERVVEIEGEAFFAVAEDQTRPFKVVSRDQEITVLGTEFNVSGYPDGSDVETTLVEGSIQLRVDASGEVVTLVPNEQSVLSGAGIHTRSVDIAPYIAWKNGEFNFNNTAFDDMMKQISRWYGVNVIYEGVIPHDKFSGTLSRNVTLQTVLEFLRISEIKYRLQENDLIIE